MGLGLAADAAVEGYLVLFASGYLDAWIERERERVHVLLMVSLRDSMYRSPYAGDLCLFSCPGPDLFPRLWHLPKYPVCTHAHTRYFLSYHTLTPFLFRPPFPSP